MKTLLSLVGICGTLVAAANLGSSHLVADRTAASVSQNYQDTTPHRKGNRYGQEKERRDTAMRSRTHKGPARTYESGKNRKDKNMYDSTEHKGMHHRMYDSTGHKGMYHHNMQHRRSSTKDSAMSDEEMMKDQRMMKGDSMDQNMTMDTVANRNRDMGDTSMMGNNRNWNRGDSSNRRWNNRDMSDSSMMNRNRNWNRSDSSNRRWNNRSDSAYNRHRRDSM